MNNLQAIVHEWYHVPKSQRNACFSVFVTIPLNIMEFLNIINTKRHNMHHKHTIDDLDAVEIWTDMWVPEFVETITDAFWKKHILKMYRQKETNMTK